jgi:guanylate kinase
MKIKATKKGLLIIISGPSGVGKGTIRRFVMEDNTLNLAYSVSMTTRAPRVGEVNGVDYFFVTKEEFLQNLKDDNLLEHAEFVGNYYGTPKNAVEKSRSEGKNVILEIEVKGTQQVLDKCKGNDVVSIFLIPPSFEELERRIRNRRTEAEEIVQQRLEKARSEMGLKYRYQHIVINDVPERAAEEIRQIIRDKLNSNIVK